MTGVPETAALDQLARRMRGSLASLRAAAETLERYPAMAAQQRARLHAVLADESQRLARLVDELESFSIGGRSADRIRLDAAEFLREVGEAMARPGLEVSWDDAGVAGHLELDLDDLRGAFRSFATELRREFAVLRCTLRAELVDAHLLLDWAWLPEPARIEEMQDWQGAALDGVGGEPSLREASRRHGGEAWFDLDRSAGDEGRRAHVRVLLPLARPLDG